MQAFVLSPLIWAWILLGQLCAANREQLLKIFGASSSPTVPIDYQRFVRGMDEIHLFCSEVFLLNVEDIERLIAACSQCRHYGGFSGLLRCRDQSGIPTAYLGILDMATNGNQGFILQAFKDGVISKKEYFELLEQALSEGKSEIFISLLLACEKGTMNYFLAHLIQDSEGESIEILSKIILANKNELWDEVCLLVRTKLKSRKHEWGSNRFVAVLLKDLQSEGPEQFASFLQKISPNPEEDCFWKKMTMEEVSLLALYSLEHGIYTENLFITIIEQSALVRGSFQMVDNEAFVQTIAKYFALTKYQTAKKLISSHAQTRLSTILQAVPDDIFKELADDQDFLSSLIEKASVKSATYFANRLSATGLKKITKFPLRRMSFAILGIFLRYFDFSDMKNEDASYILNHVDYLESGIAIEFFNSLVTEEFWQAVNLVKIYPTQLRESLYEFPARTLNLDLVEKLIMSDKIELFNVIVTKVPSLIQQLERIPLETISRWAKRLWSRPAYENLTPSAAEAIRNLANLLPNPNGLKEFILTSIEVGSMLQLNGLKVHKFAYILPGSKRYEECIGKLFREVHENQNETSLIKLQYLMGKIYSAPVFEREFAILKDKQAQVEAAEFEKYKDRLETCYICYSEFNPPLTKEDFKAQTKQCSENFHYFHHECALQLNEVGGKIPCPICKCPMRK